MRAAILRTLDALQPVIPAWRGLPMSNPFSRWEFARAWLERPDVSPFVLVVTDDDGTLLALAPWSLRKKRGAIRQLEGIRGYDAWSHDPWIRDPALIAPISDLLVETLRESRGDWDSLALILSGERSARLIERLEGFGWGFAERPGDRQGRIVDFTNGWDAYWNSRSAKFRASIRQHQRKLDALPHRYVQAGPDDYQPLLEAAIGRSQGRWDPEHHRDHWYDGLRELAAASAPRGEFSAFGLEIDGRLAAIRIYYHAGDRAYEAIQVYDPDFGDYRVGNLMSAWCFERLCRNGTRILELGDGVMEWKERMMTGLGETVLVEVGATFSGKALLGWKHVLKPQLAGLWGQSAPSR